MRDKGFTLLELMFVIAILGILAIYGVPKYHAVKEVYRLEGAAQKAASQLHVAKQMGMDKRETVYTVFQQDRVGVYRQEQGSLVLTAPALLYEGGIFFHPALNTWMEEVYENIESGSLVGWMVRFNHRGFALDYGTIMLQSLSGQTVCINIAQQTGRITLYDCEDRFKPGDPGDPGDPGGPGEPGYCDGDDGPLPDYPQWVPQNYLANSYVIYNGRPFYNRYYANASHVPGTVGTPWQEVTKQWRNFNYYVLGDIICYNGIAFQARHWSQNQQPGLLDSPWQEMTNEWRFFNEYNTGDIVLYGGFQFQARNWSKNQQPGLLTSPWQELTAEWRSFNVYNAGDQVLYNGLWYRAKWYTQNHRPDISAVWELMS